MTDINEEDRCIAKTQKGKRCSRVAKDGRFCFQHGPDSATVTEVEKESQRMFGIVADRVNFQPEQLEGVQKDIAQNFQDIFQNTKDFSGSLTSLDFNEALDAFKRTTISTARTPAKHAIVGGVAGSPGGPIGTAAGTTAGVWHGIYKVANDDRAVQAQVVEEAPTEADVIPTDHEAIEDVEPIQMAIKSAIETGEEQTEWLRTTVFRERDMDSVDSALSKIPGYQNAQGITEYYIRDQESGEVLLLISENP
jgi:hypothetical protein